MPVYNSKKYVILTVGIIWFDVLMAIKLTTFQVYTQNITYFASISERLKVNMLLYEKKPNVSVLNLLWFFLDELCWDAEESFKKINFFPTVFSKIYPIFTLINTNITLLLKWRKYIYSSIGDKLRSLLWITVVCCPVFECFWHFSGKIGRIF